METQKKSVTATEAIPAWTWWQKKRKKFNIGLIVSGIITFIIYAITVEKLVKPNHPESEMNLIFIFIQGLIYLACMFLANIFYLLGPLTEKLFKPKNIYAFRKTIYGLGFWFSFVLPFSVPIAVLINN